MAVVRQAKEEGFAIHDRGLSAVYTRLVKMPPPGKAEVNGLLQLTEQDIERNLIELKPPR